MDSVCRCLRAYAQTPWIRENLAWEQRSLEERKRRYRRILEDMTLMQDIFMRNAFQDRACVEYLLQVILEKKDLKVESHTIQADYKNLYGHSAFLDCVACDAQNRRYNVEIQQEAEGASPKRARYHSGLLDMHHLPAGEGFDQLPESYVIFITRRDVLGGGLPIYHIRRQVEETGKEFGDEAYIVYVNGENRADTELGRLMHDLNCQKADQMYSGILANRVRELKETRKGVETMCGALEQLYKEGIAIGEARGEARGESRGAEKVKRESSVSLYQRGMALEEIAQILRASENQVRGWLIESEVMKV